MSRSTEITINFALLAIVGAITVWAKDWDCISSFFFGFLLATGTAGLCVLKYSPTKTVDN